MSIRGIILGASLAAMSIAASAQTAVNSGMVSNSLKANRYNRPLGLNNVRNLPDEQLQKIGERVSANGFPAKAKAVRMIKEAESKIASKRMAKANGISTPMAFANYQESDTLFWETFANWDEAHTMPYIPSAPNRWSTKSNIDNITPYITSGSCPTWTVFQGDGYYVPYATNGYYMLVCMFGEEAYSSDGQTVIAPAPQQDEWIVSPAINSIQGTNYLSFDICYSPYNTHSFVENGEDVFDMTRIAYDVEVLVGSNMRSASFKAEDYETVYKLSTEADKQIVAAGNDDEKLAQLLYMNWHHIQIPLSKFEGSNIRVALRYTGTKGGSVLVDAIRVSDLLPTALFERPEGSFYLGYSPDAALLNVPFALMPAYKESVWTNYSNEDAKDFMWRYSVNGESGTSKERDLVMPASNPSQFTSWPTLQASAGMRVDEYNGGSITGIKAGGDASIYLDETVGVVNFSVGNFNPAKLTWSASVGQGQSAFGTGGEGFWASISNYYYNKVNGIANVFEAPTSPYVFTQVIQAFEDFLSMGATLACTVYRATDLGGGAMRIEDEVIAQTTNITEKQIPGGGSTVIFNFDKPIVIDCPIAISIDGFDDANLWTALPLAQALNHDSDKGYGFVILRNKNGNVEWVEIAGAMSANEDHSKNMEVSFCMGMNAIFPYVHSNDGDVFTVENAGGKKSFDIETYWNPNGAGKDAVDPKWNVTCSESWFKAETVVDDNAKTVTLNVIAEALPAGVKGRHGSVTISALGCEEVITVLQGEDVTAIDGVMSEGVFNGMDGVYTISGQRINSADAKNGIFLMKKGGKFVKVLK